MADLGDQVEGPQAGGLAEQAGAVMQEVLEGAGEALVEEGMGGVGPGGLRPQAGRAFALEGVEGLVDRTDGAVQVAGDGRRGQAVGAGQQNLGAASREGVGGAQARL